MPGILIHLLATPRGPPHETLTPFKLYFSGSIIVVGNVLRNGWFSGKDFA